MVNITMLCANRPRLLKQALDSIGDLSNATVTIRDAQMNSETSEIAHAFIRRLGTMMCGSDRMLGTGPARNHVIEESADHFGRGSYLYLSDDDVRFVRPDWLSILIDVYKEASKYGFKVIGAYNHPFNGPIPNKQTVLVNFYKNPARAHRWEVYPVYALASQSMLMSWDVWDQFGPFCDTPAGKVCQSEDVDFSNRIRAAGFKVGVISPALLVNTGITNSFGEKIPGWELVKSQCPQGVLCE